MAILALCWLAFVSFVGAWGEFTPAQVDNLMLEAGLLCIPFAPAGLRRRAPRPERTQRERGADPVHRTSAVLVSPLTHDKGTR